MLEEDFFQVGLFSIRVGLFLARGGLFSIGVGLFLVGGGLFLSPTVAEKSPTPAEKSPTAILKRCWTLEYFGELEFSSPFMEQWTLDARGVLKPRFKLSQIKLLLLIKLACGVDLEAFSLCLTSSQKLLAIPEASQITM